MSFLSYSSQPQTEVPVYEGFVEDTLSGLNTILHESALDAYRLTAGTYVADAIAENQIVNENASLEIVTENFVTSTFARIKKIFVAMWSKIKSWFAAIKRKLQIIFTNGEAFIKKFKNEISAKSVSGFKYEGYAWKTDSNAADSAIKAVEGELHATVQVIANAASASSDAHRNGLNSAPQGAQHKDAETNTKILKKTGSSSLEDLVSKVNKDFRGGTTKIEIAEFSKVGKDKMVTYLEGFKDQIRETEKMAQDNDHAFQNTLDAIDAAAKEIQRENDKTGDTEATKKAGAATSLASHKATVARYALSVINRMYGLKVENFQAAAREYELVLKKFLHYKSSSAVKENNTEPAYGNIFEAAYDQV